MAKKSCRELSVDGFKTQNPKHMAGGKPVSMELKCRRDDKASSSTGFMEVTVFPTLKFKEFMKYICCQTPGMIFFFSIFSWGFRYSQVNADEFHGKYKTNILSWNFSWLFSLLAHLHLLKFRFGTLHFICGLFALINRVDICVARIEILSFLKYGEVIPCYHILTKPSTVTLRLLRKELLGTEWDVTQIRGFAGFVH